MNSNTNKFSSEILYSDRINGGSMEDQSKIKKCSEKEIKSTETKSKTKKVRHLSEINLNKYTLNNALFEKQRKKNK